MPKPAAPIHNQIEPKEAFLRHLPERIAAIEENWQRLLTGSWDLSKLEKLYQRIQDLAGSSGKFGLVQISESVFSLEVYLSSFVESDIHPSERQNQEVASLIRALKSVVGETKPDRERTSSTAHQGDDQHIFYLQLSGEVAPGLVNALESLGYTVTTFKRDEEMIGEIKYQRPATIIVDAIVLPRLTQIKEALEHFREDGNRPPPIVVISSSSDLEMRLEAMRRGAEAFFITPVDAPAVAEKIVQLSKPTGDLPFRVLVVDDDRSQADFAAAILRKAQMETQSVSEPLKVLDALESFRPDLILMDLYMPDADGKELTSIIRSQNEFVSIPIVFLSGEQNADKQLDALSVGGDDFIAKPIRPRHLIATISTRIQRAREIRKQFSPQSKRDPVTGLFQKRHFFERLDGMIASQVTGQLHGGVLYIELDNLAHLHRVLGLGQTDAILAEMGTLISEVIEPQDVAARFSEGSFSVIARRAHTKELLALGESLRIAIADHDFDATDKKARITVTIGACPFQEASDDATGLVARAAKASSQAKLSGGNRVQEFSAGAVNKQDAGPDESLVGMIKNALQTDALQVLFQPFINLHDRNSENYQMMLRLRTDDGDQIAAADFLPAARRGGLAGSIDRWVVRRALAVLDERRREGKQINLLISQSAESLSDKSWVSWIREQFRHLQLVGTGLTVEFNLVDMASNLKTAKILVLSLHEMGVSVSLSRFTPNETSFKMLQYLNPDYLKVAEQFLQADAEAIAKLVDRAHELKVKVIVPRVEDPRTIGTHWVSGADYIQGNFIQRPEEELGYDFSESSPT